MKQADIHIMDISASTSTYNPIDSLRREKGASFICDGSPRGLFACHLVNTTPNRTQNASNTKGLSFCMHSFTDICL